jgi:hypothetical protein
VQKFEKNAPAGKDLFFMHFGLISRPCFDSISDENPLKKVSQNHQQIANDIAWKRMTKCSQSGSEMMIKR